MGVWAAAALVVVVALVLLAASDRRTKLGAWVLGRRRSPLARRLDYDPQRPRVIEIPHSLDGRPGYRLTVLSDSVYLGRMESHLGRSDFQVAVAPDALMNAVVLAPSRPVMTAEESASYTVTALRGIGKEIVRPIAAATMAGQDAVTYAYGLYGRRVVTEWKFEKDGWLFAVGVRHDQDDEAALIRAGESLATWTWTDPPAGVQPGMRYTRDRDGIPLQPPDPPDAPTP